MQATGSSSSSSFFSFFTGLFRAAHNAGMSPSSTQGSEKAFLGEKEIKAQEETDDVQTAEIVRDFATVDQGEVKNLRDDGDVKSPETNKSSVLDVVAATATVAGVGAATAVAAVKIAGSTGDEDVLGKDETEELPAAEERGSELEPTETPQECDNSDAKAVAETTDDDTSNDKYKTELKQDTDANSCSPGTLEEQDGTAIPLGSSRPVSAARQDDVNDSVVTRADEPDADISVKDGISSIHGEFNEATILEEPTKEADGFVVVGGNAHKDDIPTTPVNVDTRPTETVSTDYPNEEATESGENVRSMSVNEELKSTDYTVPSRPLSTDGNAPSKCESINELSRTTSVEPEIEEISTRPTSISDEKVERSGDITPSVGNGDNKTVEEHSEYSPSVDSAEEAFVSRPLSVASETHAAEIPTTVASEVTEANVHKSLTAEVVEEASLSPPTSVTSEEPTKELTQRTPISLHSETDKEQSEGSPSIESAEEAVPSRPTSVTSETSAGPVKEPTPRPLNPANEINEEGANILSPIETAEEAESNRPTSVSSETTKEPEKFGVDEIQVTVSPEVTEEATEISDRKVRSIEDTTESIDTSVPLSISNNTVEEHNDKLSSADRNEQLIDDINEGHKAKPSPEEVSEEIILTKSLNEATENDKEQIYEDSIPTRSLEQTPLGILLNEENVDGLSENLDKYSDKPCFESSENTVPNISLATNTEVIEEYDVNFGPAEAVGKELRSSPVNLATEAVENQYENVSPAEPAEETAPSRPVSAVSETVTEHEKRSSHIEIKDNSTPTKSSQDVDENVDDFERPSTVVHLEVDSITTPPSTPVNIELSEESNEKLSGDLSTEDIPQILSRTDIEIVNDTPSHEVLEDPIEVNDDNLKTSSPKSEEETIEREIFESDENIVEHESEKENIPSRPLSEASETDRVKSENTSAKSTGSAIPSRSVSVFNEPVDELVEETTRSGARSVANEEIENKTENVDVESENTVSRGSSSVTARSVSETGDIKTIHDRETSTPAQPADNIETAIASPALSAPENSTDIPISGNNLIESAAQENESTVKSASLSENEPENQGDAPNQNDFNQQDDTTDKENEAVPFINEQIDDTGVEDSATADNDTEDVEKEDSTIASIPESILTVPESMGDMELSSESSIGGPNEKSIEDTRSEESRPDEQDDSSLVANLTDEPDTDIVAQSSTSDNGDVRIVNTPDQKDKITRAIINGVEDESTGEQLYADAFGRPVPTITLIESEEPKRSDSEEENLETPSTENQEPYTAPEEKEDETLRTKELVENAGNSPVNNSQEDSESVAGSDSINLQHRDDVRSDSGTSQSRADSVVAEKGSEVDSVTTTMSATPGADGVRLASEEDHEANLQSQSGLDGSQEVALNDAATTIQATFRGFQARQALLRNVETAQVPSKENRQGSASQGAPEKQDTSDAINIPPNDHKGDKNEADVSLESSENSALHERPLADSDGPEPPGSTDEHSEELAELQKPQECDELPEHRGELRINGSEAASSGDADSSLSSAATKIQAGYRGYVTRKQMRDTVDDSTVASLTNEPSIPDSPQSFGTFSTSKEDNGVRTSGSLETAVQRQQQSTLDEIEELVGSGPSLLVDTSVYQVDNTNLPDQVPTDIDIFDEKEVNEAKEAIRGLSLDSKVDSAAKSRKNTAKPSSLQEKSTMDIDEDQKVWDTLQSELAEAATKIQSNYRGYRARQKLTREDAVQMPTTSTSSAASVDSDKMVVDTEFRASGEFHDMMVLSPGEITKLTNGNDA